MPHVHFRPKSTRKVASEAISPKHEELSPARDELQEIRLAMYKVLNDNFVERLDSTSAVSLILGEENEEGAPPSDEDFSMVPATFCTNLARALKPIIGRPNGKERSVAEQLEMDAMELLKYAEKMRNSEDMIGSRLPLALCKDKGAKKKQKRQKYELRARSNLASSSGRT